MPRIDEGALLLQTNLPAEASLDEVDRLNHRVEDLLRRRVHRLAATYHHGNPESAQQLGDPRATSHRDNAGDRWLDGIPSPHPGSPLLDPVGLLPADLFNAAKQAWLDAMAQ